MHVVGVILGLMVHHPLVALIGIGLIVILGTVGLHAAPDKIQDRVDHRAAKKFKAKRPAYMKAERLRQIREEGRRENAVFAHHKPVLDKAQKLVNSRSSRRQRRGAALLTEHNWRINKEMDIVHHAAKSARVHHDGTIKKGIRRD